MSFRSLATEPALRPRPRSPFAEWAIRALTAFLTAFGVVFVVTTAPARADYQEAHTLADDVRVVVGADGVASVERQVRYGVTAGRYKWFDIRGVEPQVALATDITVLDEAGRELVAHVTRHPKLADVVRLSFDERKGLGRGTYAFILKYVVDVAAAKSLTRDGAAWVLSHVTLPTNEGRDAMRVIFDVPASPRPPTLVDPDGSSTTLATLRLRGDRDELELVRAHVARGEAVTWSVHVDPRAFPGVVDPELRAEAPVAERPDVARAGSLGIAAVGLCAVAVAAMLAYRSKRRFATRACTARGAVARPLVPVGVAPGSVAYGALVAAAAASLLWANPTFGASLVAAAIALATHLSPRVASAPRGPGVWRSTSPAALASHLEEAPRDPFDLRRWAGVRTALALSLAVAALALIASRRWSGAAVAIPLAACAAIPLFVTGTRASLPWAPAELAERFLVPVGRAVRKLARGSGVRMTLSARVCEGTSSFDEVRLRCAPGNPLLGLRGVELALAPSPAERRAPTFELLVRFDEGSEAAAKIARLAPGRPIVVGRNPEERVLRLVPRGRGVSAAARLLVRVAFELEDRRAADRPEVSAAAAPPAWSGPERRFRPTADEPAAPSVFVRPSLRPATAAPR